MKTIHGTIYCCWCGEDVDVEIELSEVRFGVSTIQVTPKRRGTSNSFEPPITVNHTCKIINNEFKELLNG